MSIWFIVLVTVFSDGQATVDTRFPNTPEYNNEKSCNDAGNYLMEQEQMKIGTNSGTVYFICKQVTGEEIGKALKKGSGA